MLVGGTALAIYAFSGHAKFYVGLIGVGVCLLGVWMLYNAILKQVRVNVYEYGIKITKGKADKDILFSDMTEVNWYTTENRESKITTLTIRSKEYGVTGFTSEDVQNISSLCQKVEDAHFQIITKDITPENIDKQNISFGSVKLENGAFVRNNQRIPLTQFNRYMIDNGKVAFIGHEGTTFKYSITEAANLSILLHLVNNVISYYKQQNGVLSV